MPGDLALAVTTSGQPDPALAARAQAAARRWGVAYLPRRPKAPLGGLFERARALLVFGRDEVALWDAQGRLRWTPGMAALRIKRLDAGRTDDTFLRVASLRPGDAFLDCTLGLAHDALLAARAVGPQGRVVGLEKSLPLFALLEEGLARHPPGPASCPIQPLHADAVDFLRQQAPGAFDVVSFDPMFERSRPSSGDFAALRRFADPSPLTQAMLDDARRVARRFVIVKASRYSTDLSKLGLTPEPHRRLATVEWARF